MRMKHSVRAILTIPLMMLGSACSSWSDFLAQLEQPTVTAADNPVAASPDATGPMPALARVYMKAGEKALERGDTETAQRFFDKAGELAPGIALRNRETTAIAALAPATGNRRAGIPTADTGAGLKIQASELVRLYAQPSDAADEATSLHRHAISHDFFSHYALAQQTYRKALALAPNDIALRNNLALSLTLSGAYGEAVQQMSHVTATAQATAQHRHTLEMLLQLAFQQESDTNRLQAMREKWREREKTQSTPVPAELDRIAPSAGSAPEAKLSAGPSSATPDPVAWMAQRVSRWWSAFNRSLAAPEGTAHN